MHKNNITKHSINGMDIQFSGKKMTAYGGFSLLAGFLEKIEFKTAIENMIPIKEQSGNSLGVYGKVLGVLLIIFAGGDRFSHMLYLGCSEILGKLFAVPKRLPLASTTLTRMFGKIDTLKIAIELQENLWGYLLKIINWGTIKEDWLSFDSTVLVRYGEQEGVKRGYNPQKRGRGSHHPLLGFLNQSRYIINLWNRPGDATSSNNILSFFDECYARIKSLLKLNGVIADSGFYSEAFVEHLSALGLPCIIAAKFYSTLQQTIYAQTNWEKIDEGLAICEFQFQHDCWGKPYRYIAVRQTISQRKKAIGKQLMLFEIETADYRYSAWLTTKEGSPYEVWKMVRPRSNDENVIKAFKEDFALGGFSLQSFYATEAVMVIRALIYNIFVLFRNEILCKKEKPKRLLTLRYQYFVIPAHLGQSGHQHVLRLSVHTKKLKGKLNYLLHQVKQYIPPNNLHCNALT